jgi:hypothetical protein
MEARSGLIRRHNGLAFVAISDILKVESLALSGPSTYLIVPWRAMAPCAVDRLP